MKYPFLKVAVIAFLISNTACSPTSLTTIAQVTALEPSPSIAADSLTPGRTATVALTKTPTRTPKPTSTATPTQDLSQLAGVWKRYDNTDYGISFEYPALYDEAPLNEIGCQVRLSVENDVAYFDVGERIRLSIVDAHNQSLAAYVQTTVKQMQDRQLMIESQTEGLVSGAQAVTIAYRFGGPNRYGEVTVVRYGEKFYEFDYTAGSDCIAIENGQFIGEMDFTVYRRMLDSFRFVP